MNWSISLAGLVVGLTVGVTGMGGGALMTPILVLLFGVDPLAAVSTDVVASLVMKPIGGAVHARRGTVHTGIVRWLALGSVPAAFGGVLILKTLGEGEQLSNRLTTILGVTLVIAAAAMTARVVLSAHRQWATLPPADVPVRKRLTLGVGVVGGLVVGMTSVGSGSLMIVLLLTLYPRLSSSSLVGTDLVQAIPLVAAAALGHVLFGDLRLGLTGALLVGAVPGVYLGARVSSKAPDSLIRPLLVAVLIASALKLLEVPTGIVIAIGVVAGSGVAGIEWVQSRRHEVRASDVLAPEGD
ncbi:MAG: TSUP family transporter [Actinomycetes bacterium]